MIKAGKILSLAVLSVAAISYQLSADDIEDLFKTPTQEVPEEGTGTGQKPAGGSALEQYRSSIEKVQFSWSVEAGAGEYFGWKTLEGFADPEANFTRATVGMMSATSTIDVRPNDSFRLHESSSASYPSSSYSFSLSWLNELFLDYSLPSGTSFRLGKFGVTWGNARILSVANLPGRNVNVGALDPSVEVLPSWLQSPTPSLWLKGAMPLGAYTATGLASLPAAAGQGFTKLAYGLLNEFTFGKTYLGISGLYQYGKTPRLAALVKTSAFHTDFYIDSSFAFGSGGTVLPSAIGGFYFQASDGPDIKLTGELCWNGEVSDKGGLIGDALGLPQLSSAVAASWSGIGGSNLSLGLTWYHNLLDSSGACFLLGSYTILPSVKIRTVLPFVYGDASGSYVKSPPSEANGYVRGGAVLLVLSTSF